MLDELDDDDTVTHAVNAMPDSLALTATRKSVGRFLAMFQFSEADLQEAHRHPLGRPAGPRRDGPVPAVGRLRPAARRADQPPRPRQHPGDGAGAACTFPGAVIVVSHDRFFTDKVANRRLVFGADGAAASELEMSAA